MTLTYSLAEAATRIPCTERWLADGLRAGRWAGHKIMGRWRLTDRDIERIVMSCQVQMTPETDTPAFNFVTPGRGP